MSLNDYSTKELAAELRRRHLDRPEVTWATLQDRTVHLTKKQADEIVWMLTDLHTTTDNLLYEHFGTREELDARLNEIAQAIAYLEQ